MRKINIESTLYSQLIIDDENKLVIKFQPKTNVFLYCISEMRDKLRKWREENYRNSEQIVDVGEELINEHASKLGDDSKYIYSKQKQSYKKFQNTNNL